MSTPSLKKLLLGGTVFGPMRHGNWFLEKGTASTLMLQSDVPVHGVVIIGLITLPRLKLHAKLITLHPRNVQAFNPGSGGLGHGLVAVGNVGHVSLDLDLVAAASKSSSSLVH